MAEFLKAKPTTFVNKPRGIVDTRTGEAEVFEQVARLGNEVTRMAFEDAVVEQEQAGKDYVASLTTRDSDGKLQFVELPKSLSQVAKKAATPQLQKRYSNELQLDTSKKMAELHRIHKDNPVEFEKQANLYISETVNTLRNTGYGSVAGDYATNASSLLVQHSNDLKLKEYKKQEEVAHETKRITINSNLTDSYELRKNGKTDDANKLDKATIQALNELIEDDAVNAPYYREKLSELKTNQRQAIMEIQFLGFNGNAAQMAAYNRSLTLGKIAPRDKALLPNLTDQHFINQRKDLNPTEIKKLTAWGSTTKGRFADGYADTKKTFAVENTATNWQNKTLSVKDTTESNNLDIVVGQEIGLGREIKPVDVLNAGPEQINIITSGQRGNATVPTSIKQLVNNPAIIRTDVKRKLENNDIAGAQKSINNYVNIAKSTQGLIGIDKLQTSKAIDVERLMKKDNDMIGAFQAVHRPPAEQKAIAEEIKIKVLEADSSFTESNYNLNNFMRKQLKKNDYGLSALEMQDLYTVFKSALATRDSSIDDALEVVQEYVDKVYIEHPSNYNIYEKKTGSKDYGGIKSYYADQTEDVVKAINKKLSNDLGDSTETFPFTEMGGELTRQVKYELGENAFLLPDRKNGNTGDGRWTVVDAEGKMIMTEFGPIEITTKEIESMTVANNQETAKEAIADETLGKYLSWWNNFNFGSSIREALEGKGIDMDAPAPMIDTFDDTRIKPTGPEMMTNIDTRPDAMRRIIDNVDEAIDTVDRTVIQPVAEGLETAGEFLQTQAMKAKDFAVTNIISIYNQMKAEGAEIIRNTPELIEISQITEGNVVDELVNSVVANKPINTHVGAVDQLISDEDFSATQYQDGAGKSIGYGFAIASLDEEEKALIADINNISEKEAKAIINIKVKKIADKFTRDVPNFNTLSTKRQIALINFAYHLGYENVTNQGKDAGKQWPKFFELLKIASRQEAGSEQRDFYFGKVRDNMIYNYGKDGRTYTDWFTQTPNRAKRVAQDIRGY